MSIESQLHSILQVKTMNKAKEVFVAAGIQVGNLIITASPVDKGTFRNHWNTEQNRIGYDKSRADNNSGSDAREQLIVEFNAADLGDFVTFNNPMPYGPRLEYDGYSEQAPNGFVRVNTDKWESIVQEEVLKRR